MRGTGQTMDWDWNNFARRVFLDPPREGARDTGHGTEKKIKKIFVGRARARATHHRVITRVHEERRAQSYLSVMTA